jgi:hypothetical protein
MYGKLSTRRFACDRCRTYKLRCERNPTSGRSAGCERCIKANLLCKTTSEAGPIPVPKDLGASSCRVEGPQRRRATISTDRWVHDRPVSALASCPPSPRDPPLSQAGVAERNSSLLPRAASRHVEREESREQAVVNPLYILGTGTIAEESQASADLSGAAHCSLGDSDSIQLDESNQVGQNCGLYSCWATFRRLTHFHSRTLLRQWTS